MSHTAIGIKQQKDVGAARADMKLEVALLPVSDVERAKEFYRRLGWRLDRDIVMGNDLRLVQFTPPGSGCSVTFGMGVTAAAPGGLRNTLIVSDIEAAHKELVARGINASEVFHVTFEDPDGNSWLVQEVTLRLPGRIDPATTTFASVNDLASAMRRAAAAHGKHEEGNGQHDANWPDWYAAYMAAEQAGTELPW